MKPKENESLSENETKIVESQTIVLPKTSEIIDFDEERLRGLTKEFKKSLSKKTNNQDVWKDIPPMTVANTLGHYSKLSKIRLTGLFL